MNDLDYHLLPPPRFLYGEAADGEAMGEMQAAYAAGARRQLRELARMRAVGMRIVGRIDRGLRGKSSADERAGLAKGSKGFCWDFVAVARAVRQIIVLEMEVTGLRPAERNGPAPKDRPDDHTPQPRDLRPACYTPRDDLPDHYDSQPMGTAVDWIRDTLEIEPPEADPFETAGRRKRAGTEDVSAEAPPVEDADAEPTALPRRRWMDTVYRKEMAIIRDRVIEPGCYDRPPAWNRRARGPPDG